MTTVVGVSKTARKIIPTSPNFMMQTKSPQKFEELQLGLLFRHTEVATPLTQLYLMNPVTEIMFQIWKKKKKQLGFEAQRRKTYSPCF